MNNNGKLKTPAQLIAENSNRLRKCKKPHNFKIILGAKTVYALQNQVNCKRCKGTVPLAMAHWYNLGLLHGRVE